MKTLKLLFTIVIIKISILSYAQISDPNIGNTFIANDGIVAKIVNINIPSIDDTRYIIAKDYRIKIYNKIKIKGEDYYVIRIYNFFYGKDQIIRDFDPTSRDYVVTSKVPTGGGKLRIADLYATDATLDAEISDVLDELSEKEVLALNTYSRKYQISNVMQLIGGEKCYLLSQYRVDNNDFVIKVSDIVHFSPFYKKNEFFFNASYVTIPAKLRIVPKGDFVQNINLGLNADFKWRKGQSADRYWGAIFGINFSGVDYIESDFRQVSNNEKGKQFVYSPNIGIYYQRKGVQLIFGVGFDFMSKENSDYWKYQGRPNILFGVGGNLISDKEKSNATPVTEQISN